jgi:hypothetical protein
VSFFLRLTGITNAALWFGATVFFVAAAWPAFRSEEMLTILPLSHSGAAGLVLLDRFFIIQYLCGGIALGHLILEWLYAGRPLQRWTLFLVASMLALSLFSGLSAKPRLSKLHLEIYGRRSTAQQREQAGKSFRAWHGAVRFGNVILVLGIWVHLWETSRPGVTSRFVAAGKFRG